MRAFVEKSRTAHAWRGFVYQPDLSGPEDILAGLKRTKALFEKLNVPLAMEFIDPAIFPQLAPYISWGFIGARTATSQIHRIMASDAPFAFGFKHSLDGNIQTAINSTLVAKEPHCTLTQVGQKMTPGNTHTHIVLRGGLSTNYDKKSVANALELCKLSKVSSPLLIDCSHGNCINKPDDQKTVFLDVLEQYLENPSNILGVMLESNIYRGSKRDEKSYGLSLTDPCLDFEETASLLHYAKKQMINRRCKEGSNQPTFYV